MMKIIRFRHRLTGLLLALIMIVGIFPVTALAAPGGGPIANEEISLTLPVAGDELTSMPFSFSSYSGDIYLSGIQHTDTDDFMFPTGHLFQAGEKVWITIWLGSNTEYYFDTPSTVSIYPNLNGRISNRYYLSSLDVELTTEDCGAFRLLWTVPFRDVTNPGSISYDPIERVSTAGIVAGWPDGTFRPLQTCNRSQIVTFLWRMNGSDHTYDHAANPFTDIDPGYACYPAAMWAYYNNITTGYGDGTFGPWKACTRQQILTFFWRLAGAPLTYQNTPNPFSDVSGSNPFYPALMWAYRKGIATGYDDGTLRPLDACNRLAVACFIDRYLILVPVG